MKKTILLYSILLCLSSILNAQTEMSIDIAAVHSKHHQLNGLNLSSFYHFNKHITGGIEINRFFPAVRKYQDEETTFSSWDLDLNFHYQVPLSHHWMFYPVTGISHTSEKEVSSKIMGEAVTERFWSYNTGAGLLWHKGRWAPHAEYLFTWGHLNQQFFLAGFSYEIELGHKHKTHTAKE
jgi:hypothetical protein